jgi:WD40 repeat protein
MRLWDLANGRQLRVFTGHTQPIDRVQFSPNGRLAASCGREGVLRVYVLGKVK